MLHQLFTLYKSWLFVLDIIPQSNTLAQDTHLDFHVKNTFNFNLVSVNVLLGFLTLQAKQIKLKSVQLSA